MKRDGLILLVVVLGFGLDLLLYSGLSRLLGLPDAASVLLALLGAAAFNILVLDRRFNPHRHRTDRRRVLGRYLLSVLLIYVIRLAVVSVAGAWMLSASLWPEAIYIAAMGVSFVANWFVLKYLLRPDDAATTP